MMRFVEAPEALCQFSAGRGQAGMEVNCQGDV